MKYFLLKISALENSFSIAEAGREVIYRFNSATSNDAFHSVDVGDKILGFVLRDMSVKYAFNVLNKDADDSLTLQKSLEVAQGVELDQSLLNNIENENLIEIEQAEYEAIYSKFLEVIDENPLAECSTVDEVVHNVLPVRAARVGKIHPLNCILYGAPGTGKTYATPEYALAIIHNIPVDNSEKDHAARTSVINEYNSLIEDGRIVFTTFHQNYGYEDFIQGLRPDTSKGGISFKNVDGVFKTIADRAIADQENDYVIVIDEINRANISKVFGELITLIEEDKRWGELNQTSATLPSGEIFAVPNNLYIVGTMNSSDKSISLIDAALRRRFDFIELKPNSDLIKDAKVKEIFEKLNNALVSELDSTDLLVGHSYFIGKTEDDLEKVFNNKIIPLLYEYFYDNRKKVASILNDILTGTDIELVDEKLGRLSVKKK